jgi:hypothetical protein
MPKTVVIFDMAALKKLNKTVKLPKRRKKLKYYRLDAESQSWTLESCSSTMTPWQLIILCHYLSIV